MKGTPRGNETASAETLGGCVVLRREEIQLALQKPPAPGKNFLESVKACAEATGFPMKVLEDTDVVNEAEVHVEEGDFWVCLQGSVTFTVGGEMPDFWFKKLPDGNVDRREVKAKRIRGGDTVILREGDYLWIPPGVPHQHGCKGTARLGIVKIPIPQQQK